MQTHHQTQHNSTKKIKLEKKTIPSVDLIQAITSNVFRQGDSNGYLISPLNLLAPLIVLRSSPQQIISHTVAAPLFPTVNPLVSSVKLPMYCSGS